MVKTILLLVACSLFFPHLYAQNKLTTILSGMDKSKAVMGFDRKKREFYIKPGYREQNKQLLLQFAYDDSISIYLNDSLIYSQWIRDSKVHSASYNVFPFFKVTGNKNYLTIILNERKTFVRIRLRKRYFFIKMYYFNAKNKNSVWNVEFSNNKPEVD